MAGQLLRELNQRLENVQVIYERIVHAQRPLQYSPVSSNRPSGYPEARNEERGEMDVSGEVLEALAETAPLFAERLRQRGLHRSEKALNAFLSLLARDPQQSQLLNSHSALADWMLQIFELSPYLGEQLARFPELLEEIRRAVDHPTRRWAFEGLAAPLNDIGGLRRFYRREMFRILAASICFRERVFCTLGQHVGAGGVRHCARLPHCFGKGAGACPGTRHSAQAVLRSAERNDGGGARAARDARIRSRFRRRLALHHSRRGRRTASAFGRGSPSISLRF